MSITEELENLNYFDIEDLILLYYYASKKSELFQDIEFVNESGSVHEMGEKAQTILNCIEQPKNKESLCQWLIDNEINAADFLDENRSQDIVIEEEYGL